MLSRLTLNMRWKWARALAAMYLVCALAPGAAYAFGNGIDANCGLANIHKATSSGSAVADAHHDHPQHMHGSSAHHDHGADHAMAANVSKSADNSGSRAPGAPHHKADQSCCVLGCVSALPAAAAVLSLPVLDVAEQPLLFARALTTLTPAQLYKPPIA
jgi:hypothetical protein